MRNYPQKSSQSTINVLVVSSARTFPLAPYPRKFIHCTLDDLSGAAQTFYALHADGIDAGDIHVMASWDYIEAVERRKQSNLSTTLRNLLAYLDDGFADVYLHEALRGKHIFLVRLDRVERMEQVREMLARYEARLIKYVDTWTVTDLSPVPKHSHW